MRTIDRLSSTAVFGRLRAEGGRLRRSLLAQRPAIRWGLALAVIAVASGLAGLCYWTATSRSNSSVRYLVSGRSFSSDDLIKLCQVLDKQRIVYRVDEDRRVEVAAEQVEHASELVAKLDLGRHSIDEIRDQSSTWNGFWESAQEREQRKQLAREKMIEGLIGQLDGVVWSLVSINRPRAATFSRVPVKASAFVYIETKGNRPLPYQSIQAIPGILTGFEHELTPASITVMDRRGTRYFDAGNVAVGDNSRDRAREEELAEEILEKLDWIKGVRVQVRLIASRAGEPASKASTSTTAKAPTEPARAPVRAQKARSEVAMGVNEPVTLEPEPEPDRAVSPPQPAVSSFVGATETALGPAAGGHSAEARHDRERGHILVHVPRSFYIDADIRNDAREPSQLERRVMEERTERLIRTAVGLVVTDPESWKLDVDTIPDDASLSRKIVLAYPADSRRIDLDWGIVGAALAAVSILLAVGSWIHVARRPARQPEQSLKTRRFTVDSASEPAPSERVRELIRKNPEAAASVLQRWTGQGDRIS
jgi:flagellar biosynthesis/type III secretory pathway M-ring protein FliF/YscJ